MRLCNPEAQVQARSVARKATALVAAGALLAGLGGGPSLAFPAEAEAGKWDKRGPLGKRKLKPGAWGKDVRHLQRALTRMKLRTKVTGKYNKQTFRRVKELERRLEHKRGWHVNGRLTKKEGKVVKKMIRRQIARKRARATVAAGPYRFPVGDPHNFGGPGARFGAPRSGHSHQGQDVFAPCGTQVYAAQAGNIKVNAYEGSAGYYLVIDGADGTDTVYMHLINRPGVPRGTWVQAGWHIGNVGQSGNASGCHLHFEHWTAPGWYEGGSPYDPLPELQHWDSYS